MSNIGNKNIFAENLKYYVNHSGKTQKEICEYINVPPTTLNSWIKAKKYPRIDKIELLAKYFGIAKSDLIESKLTVDGEKKNDIIADIVVKMRVDDDYLDVVKSLYGLDSSKIEVVRQFLNALIK